MELQKLPLNQNTFSKLRRGNYLYVDKTEYAYKLITKEPRYFLSRPRRFGKSLFISTLQEILEGNKELFEGLWIGASDYTWQKHAVIMLDFSEMGTENCDNFKDSLVYSLIENAKRYGVILETNAGAVDIIFKSLVTALYEKYGRVAVLIDEYDRPLLHTMHTPELAMELRVIIQNFFTTIKARDKFIDFVFITGVTAFSKAGLFSGINNLTVITLNKEYAGICGYSDTEIDHYFKEYIESWVASINGLAIKTTISYEELREQIRHWYNGYHFGFNVLPVYAPLSLMKAVNGQEFENFWIQTATPTFLINEMSKEYRKLEFQVFDPEVFESSADLLGSFDITRVALPTLMFQAGYLTIKKYDSETRLYTLGYPNFEVGTAVQEYLLEAFTQLDETLVKQLSAQLKAALRTVSVTEAASVLKQFFVHVPYSLHGDKEKDYHALLHMIFVVAGLKVESEQQTSSGRIDLVIDMPKYTYIIETKFNKTAAQAMAQIKERKYYEKFLNKGKVVILLGISFNRSPHIFDIDFVAEIVSL